MKLERLDAEFARRLDIGNVELSGEDIILQWRDDPCHLLVINLKNGTWTEFDDGAC
jgi:hypothetical protein